MGGDCLELMISLVFGLIAVWINIYVSQWVDGLVEG